MLTDAQLKKMPEIEVIKIINNPDSDRNDYNKACEFLIGKYEPMIHKHWYTLQRQMGNSGYVNALKDDYYDEAREALFNAIRKVDVGRIYDDKFKLLQLASWYLTNVRTKMIKRIKRKDSKTQSLVSTMDNDDEESLTIDSSIERRYSEEHGYKDDPAYIMERKEGEENCRRGLEKCLSMWDETEMMVYRNLVAGKTKAEIAAMLGVKPTKVYAISKKMSDDLKDALDYGNLRYTYG